MTLTERISYFKKVFIMLIDTSSLNEKRAIVSCIKPELKEDFEYILDVLAGTYKFGYTYTPVDLHGDRRNENNTVKDVLQFLQEPRLLKDLSNDNINRYISQTYPWRSFFEPIVNRTLKLGIGKSVLPKDGLSAMLAKKYEGNIRSCTKGYFITEKLDGNRCIARFDGTKWVFTSRNGKIMNVEFDMSGLPTEYIYDGEILMPKQVEMSMEIYRYLNDGGIAKKYDNAFSEASGLINRHNLHKHLVYNIFDIMADDVKYEDRRLELNSLAPDSNDVRIVPILARYNSTNDLNTNIGNILDKVIDVGGEGLMINIGDANYTHKRTNDLLKVKPTYTIDMRVTGLQYGTGKYEGMIGALEAECKDLGVTIYCKIGTGLSDEQRLAWALRPEEIVGKIIEVAYFSLSQDSNARGTNNYSLRFPRLKSVRHDKNETSIH